MRLRSQNQEDNETSLSSADNSLSAELYQRYAPKMLAYLCHHISSLDDAEDLLLEVFLAALEKEHMLSRLSEDEQRAWLWTVARNKMIDYHRRTQRRRIVPLEQVEETMFDELLPEQVALQQEEHTTLHIYLKQLPTVQQEILQLRFTAGLRCTEIATVLNKSEGAIRTMLSRTLNTLRNIYSKGGDSNGRE
jgi:RNA polymerase sigma factor (sigma-70 family)